MRRFGAAPASPEVSINSSTFGDFKEPSLDAEELHDGGLFDNVFESPRVHTGPTAFWTAPLLDWDPYVDACRSAGQILSYGARRAGLPLPQSAPRLSLDRHSLSESSAPMAPPPSQDPLVFSPSRVRDLEERDKPRPAANPNPNP
uniref:Uncharacterized protein n=1 Tax=Phaeomonas parva TaxID=124430 RepID=A0A7S1XQW8_9STRA|mmetsp:Transcript_2522/g.7446  ORF Transcript_2522/g.7446 Transcript_2522/m.7446 type:complete len:145 (+) Transcript_2522:84-518(+)